MCCASNIPLLGGIGIPKRECWARGSAEQIWGDFFLLAWRIFGKLPANFSAEFDGEVFPRVYRPCSSRVSAPPQKNFTPKFVGIVLEFHFFEPKMFHVDFLLTGETNEWSVTSFFFICANMNLSAQRIDREWSCAVIQSDATVPLLHLHWNFRWGKFN